MDDHHVDQSSEFVANVFHTDGSRPYSPLLLLSVLELLAGAKNRAASNPDDSYVSVTDLVSYFEPCQVEGDDLREVTKLLLKRRPVEPLEPDWDDFSDGMRIALTPAGEPIGRTEPAVEPCVTAPDYDRTPMAFAPQ